MNKIACVCHRNAEGELPSRHAAKACSRPSLYSRTRASWSSRGMQTGHRGGNAEGFCTREKGHTGDHIACGETEHFLFQWGNTRPGAYDEIMKPKAFMYQMGKILHGR
jgi:hypothetical protein